MLDLLDVCCHSQLRVSASSRRPGLLVTLWFKTSSSFTTLSSSVRLFSSTTNTFHWRRHSQFKRASWRGTGTGEGERTSFPTVWRIASRMTGTPSVSRPRVFQARGDSYLLSRCMLIKEVPILAGRLRPAA